MRIQKINKLIKQQLSILVQNTFAEKYGFICISDVDVSKDLKSAYVYIIQKTSTNISNQNMIKDLQLKAELFRRTLGKILTLRDMPRFTFILDNSLEKINKVEQLLNVVELEK